jgi:hypothetical protein
MLYVVDIALEFRVYCLFRPLLTIRSIFWIQNSKFGIHEQRIILKPEDYFFHI